MQLPGPDKLKTLWDKWEIRVFILVSLSLQAVLTLLTPWRKRTGKGVVISLIWTVYLLADWVAAATVGKISSNQVRGCRPSENADLVVLWAPFLLLHLGGPDTISSFSLQDNELWPRHLCGLVLQDLAALYIFIKSLPGDKLLLSTMLVLIAGTVRYAERIQALYAASLDGFGDSVFRKPDPGPEYEKVVEIYNSLKLSGMPTQFVTIDRRGSNYSTRAPEVQAATINGNSTAMAVLENGYKLFKTFKGLIVGYVFTAKERQESRNFFLNQNALHAFRLVEVELSFLYEILHTKTFVLRYKWGCIWRLISYFSILAAFASFYIVEKDGFRESDVFITYLLFSGAVSLDVISLFTLLFSDRAALAIKSKWHNYFLEKRKRWSGKVSQCNLIEFCLHKESNLLNKIAELVRMRGRLDKIRLSFWKHNCEVDDNLKEFIFKELRRRSLVAKDVEAASKISSHRGDWALSDTGIHLNSELYSSIVEVPYIESVLLWHIATTLCYEEGTDEGSNQREICKTLSDYVFYLLVLRPNMMSAFSSNWQLMFQDTCAEANRFLRNMKFENLDVNLRSTCQKILSVGTPVKPGHVKGYGSKSVLFAACSLAKCLKELQQKRWEIMGGVWVELLSYAANHCKVDVNAEQLSKGGELLTIVWFLLTHLGMGKQFDMDDGARVQIVVTK